MNREERTPSGDRLERHLDRLGEGLRSGLGAREETFVTRFSARLALRETSAADVVPVGRATPRWRVWLAAAALLGMIAGGTSWYLAGPGRPAGELVFARNGVLVDGVAASGARLEAGSVLSTAKGSGALVALDSERARLYLAENTRVVVDSARHLRLLAGALWIEVERGHGEFAVDFGEGTVTVLGTAFATARYPESASVFLARGAVRVEAGSSAVELEPATEATVRGDQRLDVTRHSPTSPPAWASLLFTGYEAAYTERYFPSAVPESGRSRP
ncbi:MAG: FecR domain-containing protein [Candidatus Sumerlaeia bacterium]|nr:FecR domain-containing protein [Candidatus Sumerlaeia bacterium]